jgi:hypothetical protein
MAIRIARTGRFSEIARIAVFRKLSEFWSESGGFCFWCSLCTIRYGTTYVTATLSGKRIGSAVGRGRCRRCGGHETTYLCTVAAVDGNV